MKREFALLFAVFLTPTALLAADATSVPVAPDEQFTVSLSLQEWQLINNSVLRSDIISAKQANDLLTKINLQLQAQMRPTKAK